MGLWVGLDSIADPGNLGTIMRTMDAVGAKGIFLIDHCTDPYDPSAIRASMGAVFSLELIKLTTEELDSLETDQFGLCLRNLRCGTCRLSRSWLSGQHDLDDGERTSGITP